MGMVEELAKMSLEELKAENEKMIKDSYPYSPIIMAIMERDKFHNEQREKELNEKLELSREKDRLTRESNMAKGFNRNKIVDRLYDLKEDTDFLEVEQIKKDILKNVGLMLLDESLFIAEKYGFINVSQWDNGHLDMYPTRCPICGSDELKEYNRDFITDSIIGEYDIKCNNCEDFKTHFAYGNYDLTDYRYMNEESTKELSKKIK